MNLYQDAKNEAVSLICSGEMVVLKILQSEWLRAFWSLSQEQDLSQIEDLCRNTANDTNFHCNKIQGISKNHLFANFWAIFAITWAKKYSHKIWLCQTQLDKFLEQCWSSEKPNDPIPRNSQQKTGWIDRPYFRGPFQLLPGVQQYNCSRLAFKSQRYRVECWSNQHLLPHSQHPKHQLNSKNHSWHKVDFRVSWTKRPCPFLTIPTQ